MSELKCPFCQQELEDANIHSSGLYFECPNCYEKQKEKDDNYTATPKVWQELIRTRKALEIAVDALTNAREEIGKIKNDECPCGKPHIWFEIDNALQTIARILKVKQKD